MVFKGPPLPSIILHRVGYCCGNKNINSISIHGSTGGRRHVARRLLPLLGVSSSGVGPRSFSSRRRLNDTTSTLQAGKETRIHSNTTRNRNRNKQRPRGMTRTAGYEENEGARPQYFQQAPPPPSTPRTTARSTTSEDHHNDNNSTNNNAAADPSLLIGPYELLGTSIRCRHWRHLSPCLGAALAVSSPIVSNLLRLGQQQHHHHQQQQQHDGTSASASMDRLFAQQFAHIGVLTNNVFFQLIRESPVHVIRNKSMPAAFLTPGIIGTILSHSVLTSSKKTNTTKNTAKKKKKKNTTHTNNRSNHILAVEDDEQKQKKQLFTEALRREYGIKSNKIQETHWTGISVARWLDLLIVPPPRGAASALSSSASASASASTASLEFYHQSLIATVWLIGLWGVAPTQQSLQDYYTALERSGICRSTATTTATAATSSSLSSSAVSFVESDFSPDSVAVAMDELIDYYSRSSSNGNSRSNTATTETETTLARSLELVCAAIVLEHQNSNGSTKHHDDSSSSSSGSTTRKSSSRGGSSGTATGFTARPNGYYSYDGGATKADCVEVMIREIFYLLLWDETQNQLAIETAATNATTTNRSSTNRRLPHTLRPELQHLLLQEKHNAFPSQHELGQAWFDLFSNIPHCDYLATSPNAKQFELAPTVANISKVLWYLLMTGEKTIPIEDDNDEVNDRNNHPPMWTSLQELADYWSSVDGCSQQLFVRQDILRHEVAAGGSSTRNKVIEHEIVYLHHGGRAMELRLRCDWEQSSGMAAVTHLIQPRSRGRSTSQRPTIDPKQVQKLLDVCYQRQEHHNNDDTINNDVNDPSLAMLCLALQSASLSRSYVSQGTKMDDSDSANDNYDGNFDDDSCSATNNKNDYNKLPLLLSWLATPYGPDRRKIRLYFDQQQQSQPQQFMSFFDNDRQEALQESQQLLKTRIIEACHLCRTYPKMGKILLVWLLQESPTVIEKSSESFSSSSFVTIHDDDHGGNNSVATATKSIVSSSSSIVPTVADIDGIEDAILSLPDSVLLPENNNDELFEAIEWNWALLRGRRGRSVSRVLRWKYGRTSLLDLSRSAFSSSSSIREMIDVAVLLVRQNKGNRKT